VPVLLQVSVDRRERCVTSIDHECDDCGAAHSLIFILHLHSHSRPRHYVWKYFTCCPTCLEPIVDCERGGRVTVCDIEYHRDCVLCGVCRVHLDIELGNPERQIHVQPMKSSSENRSKRQMLLCEAHQHHVEVESTLSVHRGTEARAEPAHRMCVSVVMLA
jgi:hypothetical protein